MVNEKRIIAPLNYHFIINELANWQKSKLAAPSDRDGARVPMHSGEGGVTPHSLSAEQHGSSPERRTPTPGLRSPREPTPEATAPLREA